MPRFVDGSIVCRIQIPVADEAGGSKTHEINPPIALRSGPLNRLQIQVCISPIFFKCEDAREHARSGVIANSSISSANLSAAAATLCGVAVDFTSIIPTTASGVTKDKSPSRNNAGLDASVITTSPRNPARRRPTWEDTVSTSAEARSPSTRRLSANGHLR
jgi:hypothetical protein